VVKPHSAPENIMDMINQYGYGNTTPAVVTTFQYPANDDLEATKKHLENEVPGHYDAIEDVKAILEKFQMKGEDPPPRQLHRLDTYERRLGQAKEGQALLNTLPMEIGKVIYSSGEAISSKKSIINWAIIETSSAQASQNRNKLPSSQRGDLIGKLASFYDTGELDYNVSDNAPQYACDFAEIEKGKWYFKIGRTTGLTTGVCHGTEVEVQRQGQIRWDEDGNKVILDKQSTSELVIMGKSGGTFEGTPETFSEPGDSGSFVINSLSEVAGLLYGELTGYVGPADRRKLYINAGLVTSMDEVLASIKVKTGGDLSLP
jgi:hypothetical protein